MFSFPYMLGAFCVTRPYVISCAAWRVTFYVTRHAAQVTLYFRRELILLLLLLLLPEGTCH